MDLLSDSIFIKNIIGTVILGHTPSQVTEVYMGLYYHPDSQNTARKTLLILCRVLSFDSTLIGYCLLGLRHLSLNNLKSLLDITNKTRLLSTETKLNRNNF